MQQFCNDSRIVENVYKMFVLTNVLKMLGANGFVYEQAITSNIPTQRSLCFFPPHLDSSTLPLFGREPYHCM